MSESSGAGRGRHRLRSGSSGCMPVAVLVPLNTYCAHRSCSSPSCLHNGPMSGSSRALLALIPFDRGSSHRLPNTAIARCLSLPPVKLHCSMLAEDAIKAAVSDYKQKQTKANNKRAADVTATPVTTATVQTAA